MSDALAEALWEAFLSRVDAPLSFSGSVDHSRDPVADAVAAVRHASYGPRALAMLEAAGRPADANPHDLDRPGRPAWGARMVGELRYAPAVPALVTALLTPEKRPMSFIVHAALGAMPSAAEPELVAALSGQGSYGALAASYPDRDDVPLVATALGRIGRPAGRDAVVEALGRTRIDDHRAELANELPRFPAEPRAIAAFQRAYEKLPVGKRMREYPLSQRGLALRRASRFFDPTLTPWLLKQVTNAKGAADALDVVDAGLGAAIELMTADQVGLVEPVVRAMGGTELRAAYAAGAAAALRCRADRACWTAALGTPASASASTEHAKAICALVALPDAGPRDALTRALDGLATTRAQPLLVDALLRLSPDGDAHLAERMDALATRVFGLSPGPLNPHYWDALALAEAAATLRARVP